MLDTTLSHTATARSGLRSTPVVPAARGGDTTSGNTSIDIDAKADSFADLLAAAIGSFLETRGAGSQIEIGIRAGDGQDSDGRQFVVTLKDVTGGTAAAGASAASAPADSTSHLMYSGTNPYIPKPASTVAPAPTNEVDAYWAMQPVEVQQLRHIADEGERTARALELASQGFLIDVPIMIWKWDPYTTMRGRQTAGYTWVPGAGGKPVDVGPGIGFPGAEPYDESNPPAGSIRVSTAFAEGLEHTSPWWRDPEAPELPPGQGIVALGPQQDPGVAAAALAVVENRLRFGASG